MMIDDPFDLHTGSQRRFSWAFLLVFPFIVLAFVPKVKYFFPYRFVGIFIVVMIVTAVLNLLNQRQTVAGRFFWAGSVSIVLYKLLVPVLRQISDAEALYFLGTPLLVDLVLVFAPMVLMHYAYVNGRKHELFLCVGLIVACITYGSISTINADAGFGRVLAVGSEALDVNAMYDRAEAIMAGTLGYGLTYASVIVLTALLYQLSAFKVVFRPFVLVEIVILVFGVLRAAFSIAVLQLAMSVGFVFLAKCLPYRLFKAVAILMCLVVALGMSYPSIFSWLREPLYEVAEVVDIPEYKMRITSIADSISGKEDSYATRRTELGRQSARAFLKHPLLGCGLHHFFARSGHRAGEDDWIGGHSFVFDGLAVAGVFGFLICVFGIWCMIKYLYWLFDRYGDGADSKKGWLCGFLPHVVVAVANPTGSHEIITALFLVSPAIFLMFPKRRNRIPMRFH